MIVHTFCILDVKENIKYFLVSYMKIVIVIKVWKW